MPVCKSCRNEVETEELKTVTVHGKKQRLCEDCIERLEEEDTIARDSESVVQGMMGFKGRR